MEKVEAIVTVGTVLLVVLVLVFVFAGVRAHSTLPCEAFASYAAKDVPARCISYYQGGR